MSRRRDRELGGKDKDGESHSVTYNLNFNGQPLETRADLSRAVAELLRTESQRVRTDSVRSSDERPQVGTGSVPSRAFEGTESVPTNSEALSLRLTLDAMAETLRDYAKARVEGRDDDAGGYLDALVDWSHEWDTLEDETDLFLGSLAILEGDLLEVTPELQRRVERALGLPEPYGCNEEDRFSPAPPIDCQITPRSVA